MTPPPGENKISAENRPPEAGSRLAASEQDCAWLWILGLAMAIPTAVFFAFRAASGIAMTEPVALAVAVAVTVSLLGAASAYLLYRAGQQAAASRAQFEAAAANADLLRATAQNAIASPRRWMTCRSAASRPIGRGA